jgi:hypothetical protein
MRSTLQWAVVGAALFAASAVAQETKRELGTHVHGQGALDVAIEGKRVVMELRAPGNDIVGFEGAAKTAAAKRTLATAIATLEKPEPLFVMQETAQCTVVSAKVEIGTDDAHASPPPTKGTTAKHAHGGHSHGKQGHDKHGHDKKAQAKDEHSEFHAAYEFTCAKPELLAAIDIGFFKAFPKAQKLAVQIITAKGQTATEATPAKPRLDLGALVK